MNSRGGWISDLDEEPSDYWRLCDELTVRQAALLIVDVDPASLAGSACEDWHIRERPRGYEAAKQAIGAALRNGTILGKQVGLPVFDINRDEVDWVPNTTDPDRATVTRPSLIAWLSSRGIHSGFFFPVKTGAPCAPDYLDPKNPRYAPKLAAAVRAWQAVTDPGGRSPKQALVKWLREHAAEFGMTDDDGKTNESGIEEAAKVANWQPGGGAPKTPSE